MGAYRNPLFRKKSIVAWYDSDAACLVTIVCLVPLFFFGLLGIWVVHRQPIYREHVWVPAALVVLSASAIISMVTRMLRRR
jgi:hypothetical protein